MTDRSEDMIVCDIALHAIKKLREVLKEYTAMILRSIEFKSTCGSREYHLYSFSQIWCRLYEINNYVHGLSFVKDLAPRTEKLFTSIEHYKESKLFNITTNEYLHIVELIGELIDPIPDLIDIVEHRINQVRSP